MGRKTAARLALEFQASPLAALSGAGGEAAAANLETEQALSVLGYKKAEIDRALSSLPADAPTEIAARIRAALAMLAK